MARERVSKQNAIVNWLNPTPPSYPHDAPNILSLNQALQLVKSVRDAESESPHSKKATPRQNQRDCHRCGKKGHSAKDIAEDGSFKCPTRITDAQTMSTELARLRAEFTAELAATRQKDQQQQQQQQLFTHQQNQQHEYQPLLHQSQHNRYHHHLHPRQTLESYKTALQKRNRALPVWSTNYFALYHTLQSKSGLTRFVDCSGKSHFVKLYNEGMRRYAEEVREREEKEEREREGKEVLWPNVQVVVVGRRTVGV
ncbi:hypothetical protein BM1_02323 [Bipolaris maydis]|nr:hypothetical protein BM1_02323 [Bipolaris maydis]KAJ5062964.1 hypothetical protein J3E74DRAFT_288634 [Bipolaris maydis]